MVDPEGKHTRQRLLRKMPGKEENEEDAEDKSGA